MLLIVGLGNPGKKYEGTHHSIGFVVADALASRFCFPEFSSRSHAYISVGNIASHKVMLMKPSTFMNNSGSAVLKEVSMNKIPPESIFVVHDDVDLKPGVVKVKRGGSSGGHNGIRSVDSAIGTEYFRIRLGVGRPECGSLSSYVLSNFCAPEVVTDMVNKISSNLVTLLDGNVSEFVSSVSGRAN